MNKALESSFHMRVIQGLTNWCVQCIFLWHPDNSHVRDKEAGERVGSVIDSHSCSPKIHMGNI